MGNSIRSRRRRKAHIAIAPGRYAGTSRTGRGTGRAASPRRGSRATSESFAVRLAKAAAAFLRRHAVWAAAGALALAAGIVCLILFTGGDRQVSAPAAEATPGQSVSASMDYTVIESYSYEDVDADTLAGLAGTDEELFSDDAEMEAALLEAEGIRVGVTVQSLPDAISEAILGRMEALSTAAQQSRRIYKTFYYNAGGSGMQQIQDVRSLLNNEVDVIIVGSTDADSFEKVCYMAAEAGVPVVAYDAPVSQGYAVNVITDQKEWGSVYGEFVAQNLAEGHVLCVLGSETSAMDQQRAQGIAEALAANPSLTLLDPVYASWKKNKARDAVAELLEDHERIDAVITEEGMAEGILDAFIKADKFPAVMCGDMTAGFIQKWYALKVAGLPVEDPDAEDDAEPTPTPMLFFAPEDTLNACAQPAPVEAGAAAFEIAVRLAEGRSLKTQGAALACPVTVFVTSANLAQYHDAAKDLDSSALIGDDLPGDAIEALFEAAPEATPSPAAQPTPSAASPGV